MNKKCTTENFLRGIKRFPRWVSNGNGYAVLEWQEPYSSITAIAVIPIISTALSIVVLFAAALAQGEPFAVWVFVTVVLTSTYAMLRKLGERVCKLGENNET